MKLINALHSFPNLIVSHFKLSLCKLVSMVAMISLYYIHITCDSTLENDPYRAKLYTNPQCAYASEVYCNRFVSVCVSVPALTVLTVKFKRL